MNTAVIILIILFVIMLVLMLNLLLHKQPEKASQPDIQQPETANSEQVSEDTEALETEEMKKTDYMDDEDLLFDQSVLDEMLNEDVDFDMSALDTSENEPEFADTETDQPDQEPSFADEGDYLTSILEAEEESDDVSLLRQGVRIAWPESDVMMVSAAFGSSVLYIWEGLAETDDLILFDVHEKGLGYPLLETARRISDANLKPACRFAFLIHTDDSGLKQSRNEASAFMRNEKRTPSFVISDYAGEHVETGALSEYEMITVGSRPYVVLSSDAPADVTEGIVKMSVKNLKTEEVNETALEAFGRMKKHISSLQRSRLKHGFSAKSAARKIASAIPETAAWLTPQLNVSASENGSYVRLSAPDEASLETALSELRENMRLNGHSFRMIESQKESVPVSVNDEAFRKIEKALEKAGNEKTLIPVLALNDYTFRGLRTLSFAADQMKRRELDQLLMSLLGSAG